MTTTATSGGRAAGPRVPRRTLAIRARRVSGPLAGAAAAPAIPPQPFPAPRHKPARPPRPRPVAPAGGALARGALARLRALPDHGLIDRLVRGRVWIPLLGVMLAGIVAMQVEVLKLGASLGRWVERTSVVAGRNAQLRASVASLADDQRIERLAAGMGMVMPQPTALQFLPAPSAADLAAALAGIRAPDPARFLASLPASSLSVAPGSGLASALATGASQPPASQSTATAPASPAMAPATQLGQGAAGGAPAGGPSSAAAQVPAGTTSAGPPPPPPGSAATSSGSAATSSGSAARSSGSAATSSGGAPGRTGAAGLPGGQAGGG
jgi:hypothetical protein